MRIRQLRGWLMRLFGLFDHGRRGREFAEELESHLALSIEDNLRAGMSPEEARRRALVKLGGVTLTKERAREQGGLILLANSKSSNFNGFQSGHPGGTTKSTALSIESAG
jgi:hypothetical protein